VTVTVTVKDQFGNTRPGSTVSPAATGTGNTFSPASGTTDVNGVFTSTYNSISAALHTISATANFLALTQIQNVTVNAAAPASVSVVNFGFSARVGTGVGTLPTYTVRDAFSNLVPSYPVTYSSFNSGGFAGPSSTNGSGQVTLTSWTMAGTAADDAFGRMPNQVTVTAIGFSGTATDYGIYTYSLDAGPLITGVSSGCDGCHYALWTWSNIVGVTQSDVAPYNSCTTANSPPLLVSAGSANNSLIYVKVAGTAGCGSPMPPPSGGLTGTQLKTIRAWINNGALNN